MRAPDSSLPLPFKPPLVPGWAVPRAPLKDLPDAAYMAGASLNSLDNLIRAEPPWIGAWRQRVALSAAANAARLLGHREDAAALRDTWHLCPPGSDAGPAGNLLAAWRRLVTRSAVVDAEGLRSLAGLLGLAWTPVFERIPDVIEDAMRIARPAPLIAAAVACEVTALAPHNEALAWWLADLTLARAMRWPIPVPVLATQIYAPALRSDHRLRPGENVKAVSLCLAAAAGAAEACRVGLEIAHSAARLTAVAPKLRSKGAGKVIQLLLDDDVVPGTLQTDTISRWASRRLFERLEALEAVREFSGRTTFRLYGL